MSQRTFQKKDTFVGMQLIKKLKTQNLLQDERLIRICNSQGSVDPGKRVFITKAAMLKSLRESANYIYKRFLCISYRWQKKFIYPMNNKSEKFRFMKVAINRDAQHENVITGLPGDCYQQSNTITGFPGNRRLKANVFTGFPGNQLQTASFKAGRPVPICDTLPKIRLCFERKYCLSGIERLSNLTSKMMHRQKVALKCSNRNAGTQYNQKICSDEGADNVEGLNDTFGKLSGCSSGRQSVKVLSIIQKNEGRSQRQAKNGDSIVQHRSDKSLSSDTKMLAQACKTYQDLIINSLIFDTKVYGTQQEFAEHALWYIQSQSKAELFKLKQSLSRLKEGKYEHRFRSLVEKFRIKNKLCAINATFVENVAASNGANLPEVLSIDQRRLAVRANTNSVTVNTVASRSDRPPALWLHQKLKSGGFHRGKKTCNLSQAPCNRDFTPGVDALADNCTCMQVLPDKKIFNSTNNRLNSIDSVEFDTRSKQQSEEQLAISLNRAKRAKKADDLSCKFCKVDNLQIPVGLHLGNRSAGTSKAKLCPEKEKKRLTQELVDEPSLSEQHGRCGLSSAKPDKPVCLLSHFR